ncbi:MAG: hypothetical protein A2X61_08725 [Ignavibacteria bacterium GWB2_35_12]|nr:MAG: hypothetical protein A2X63_08130 [Ignavibacteria bacterium GWA2_35_8]OGU40706.1 MAG: hypothetical protein A2X61_08725 [Ignavibacteria bacterium GWB2_35_12]OGU97291.1 MAG: hypothetical protein A2220_07530 [Ignavibacteria bacterium RIFOXYA2_FULL_35_10]OGV22388.1 MAG: hypothetical protein A2475_15890 [Ignavibacteria bacterium RIFOXYC2_FULL_35_21]
MKKKYFLKSAFIALIFLIASISSYATDLKVQSIIQPKGIAQLLFQYQIIFIIANINRLPALNYYNQVTITKKNDPTYQWSTTVEGIPIDSFTTQQHSSAESWTPVNPGEYTIKVQVFFDDDIDHSNDTISSSITVEEPGEPFLKFPFQLGQVQYYHPRPVDNSNTGLMSVTYSNLDTTTYVNVMGRVDSSNPYKWIVQNAPLFPFHDPSTSTFFFDFDDLNVAPDTRVTTMDISITWTDKILSSPFEVTRDTSIAVNQVLYDVATTNEVVDSIFNVPSFTPTIIWDTTKPTTFNYRGCTVPNIDLNSTLYNPTTVPGYAGDKNACGPAAAGNSLEWLEKTHPKTPLTGTTHREKMVELSKMMDRANEDGVTTQQLVKGKLAFIDKYRLPIRVKFQSVFVGDSTIKSPGNNSSNEAKNHNSGNKTPPKWDWLKQEFEHGEDVEILFGWYDSTGNRNGGHWITVTGISEIGTAKGIYFKDDWEQGAAGGLRHPYSNWIEGDNGWSRIKGLDEGNSICWVESVVSESYDSTVHQDAEPLGMNECRFFEMMFGLDEKKGEVEVEVTPADEPRYLNMWATKTDSKEFKWIGWNIFLAPFSVSQKYTFFYDFEDIGYQISEPHDSIRFAMTVTDTPITKKDTIKHYVDYKLGTTNIVIGNGSADEDLITFPPITPSIPGFEGWNLKTWVYRGCEMPNIDLDSTRNNPGTLAGYAGDKNACGPAAAANSLEWLEQTHNKIDSTSTHRDKLKELSSLMNRANNAGVMRADFIKAKLSFIDKYKLPIHVKFQGFMFDTNDINSPNPAFGHKAENKNDSNRMPSQWDWLVQEMQKGEDVELEFGYYDNTGTRKGGHWITVTGVSDVTTAKGIYFKDDLNQRDSSGLRNPYVNLKDTLGYTYLQQLSTASGYTCWIETLVSESYDSTITFTGVEEQQLKEEYKLKIIPNPSPAGKNIDISLILPLTSIVEAEIFDLRGNLVSTLFTGVIQQGQQKFNWESKNLQGQNVSAGTYVLSIKIDGILLSEKIIIE